MSADDEMFQKSAILSCMINVRFRVQCPCTQAFLANEDLGDSLDSVEALIKKHEDFEKSLAAQEEKIKALDEFATKLIENEHYAADDVAARRDAVSDTPLYSLKHYHIEVAILPKQPFFCQYNMRLCLFLL